MSLVFGKIGKESSKASEDLFSIRTERLDVIELFRCEAIDLFLCEVPFLLGTLPHGRVFIHVAAKVIAQIGDKHVIEFAIFPSQPSPRIYVFLSRRLIVAVR